MFWMCARRPDVLPWAAAACALCGAADMSGLLLAQNELRGDEVDNEKSREHQYVGPKLLEAERLGEGADADRLVPRRGKAQAQRSSATGQRRDRHQQSGKI